VAGVGVSEFGYPPRKRTPDTGLTSISVAEAASPLHWPPRPNSEPLFRSLDSAAIADDIFRARRSVCYAAPGFQKEPAEAMAALARRIGPELITVCSQRSRCSRMSSSIDLKSDSRASARVARVVASAKRLTTADGVGQGSVIPFARGSRSAWGGRGSSKAGRPQSP
jgi:hypothetical protein